MTVASAVAHPNIALVKYWGKRDTALNLPSVPSLSLTLGGWETRTTVTWGAPRDEVRHDGAPASEKFARRALAFLDALAPGRPPARIDTANSFPSGAGLASSASGFAALALAASAAAGLPTDAATVSALARRGSGSACRSLYGGFVRWDLGTAADGSDSRAVQVAPADHWDLRMVVAVVSAAEKPVGSTEGMKRSQRSSPLWSAWVSQAPADVAAAEAAVRARDLDALGRVMEASTHKMFATMHTADPPLVYWQPGTLAVLHAVLALRAAGTPAFATMDAGPQVKILCRAADAPAIADAVRPLVSRAEILAPGGPARLL